MGRPPLAVAMRDQLDELLLSDLYSLREIAGRLGIGHETVRRRRMVLLAAGADSRTFERGGQVCVLAAGERMLETPIRCRGACGGLIYVLPCRTCAALARLQRDRMARQLGQIKLRAADTKIGQRQRELFAVVQPGGPDLPAPQKKRRPPAIGAGAVSRRRRPPKGWSDADPGESYF